MSLQKTKLPNNTRATIINELDLVTDLWYSFFKVIAQNFQELIDDTGCIRLPLFTDSTRPAAGVQGRVIFNTTSNKIEYDNGIVWTAL